MPDEDQAVLETVESSEEQDSSALNPVDDATQDAEATSPGEPGVEVDPNAPTVESLQSEVTRLQQEVQQRTAAYDNVEGQRRQYEQQVYQFQQKEEAALAEIRNDETKHLDMVSDPQKFEAYNNRMVALQVSKALQQRDASMAASQQKVDGMQAMNEVRDFAINEAKMTEPQLQAFMAQHQVYDPVSRQMLAPFAGYPAKQAAEIAKSLIRDSHWEKFSKKQQETADKSAASKAEQTLKTALPSGAPQTEGGPKSSGDTYREALRSHATESNPDNWV